MSGYSLFFPDEQGLPAPEGGTYWDDFQEAEAPFDPDLWLYRERTMALLRRYLQASIEVGRLPSLLGRELFRSRITRYSMTSFEDGVIFVHDVERALHQLSEIGRHLISVMVFQDYSQDDAAELLRRSRRTVRREFAVALDRISELFLAGGLLNRLPEPPCGNRCQEAGEGSFSLTDCKQAE